MPSTLSPEQEENKRDSYDDITPDFLKRRENLDNPDTSDNRAAGEPSDPRGGSKASRARGGDHVTGPEKSLYRPRGASDDSSGMGSLRNWAARRRRRLIAAMALLVAAAAAAILLFIASAPFKILHIMNNLTHTYNSATENATEHLTDRMFQNYLRKHVFPNYWRCGTTVSKNCRVTIPGGGNPVTQLYRAWAQNRIEQKLATKHKIEFKYISGKWYLKAPGLSRDIDIDDFARGDVVDLHDSKDFKRLGAHDFRVTLNKAVKSETRWYHALYRYKISRLAQIKTGLPRCVLKCDSRATKAADTFKEWKLNQKNKAYRLVLTNRVLGPRDEMEALVLKCMFTISCNLDLNPSEPEKDPKTGKCTGKCNENGRGLTGAERDIRSQILNLPDRFGVDRKEKLANAQKKMDEIASYRSYRHYLLTTVITDLLAGLGKDKAENVDTKDVKDKEEVKKSVKAATAKLGTGVSVMGWVFFLADLVYFYDTLATWGSQIGYVVNSTGMAAMYQTYQTYADESKTGGITENMLGSMVGGLGFSEATDVGGMTQAECMPLYQAVVSPGRKRGTIVVNPLGETAYAKSKCNPRCENYHGQPGPPRGLTCITERLDTPSKAEKLRNRVESTSKEAKWGINIMSKVGEWKNDILAGTVSFVCNLPIVEQICNLAEKAFKYFFSVLAKIPGFNILAEFMGKIFADFFMPPTPITLNMSGGRTFDMIAGGADVIGNDAAHYTLGGVKLTNRQIGEIVTEQQQKRLAEYQNQSFFAQMFDTESEYAPLPRLALSLPSNPAGLAKNSIANFLSNPISNLLHSFGSIFNLTHLPLTTTAHAASNIPACSDVTPPGERPRYYLDDSGSGLRYWDTDDWSFVPKGIEVTATYQDGRWAGLNPDKSGYDGNTRAPDYCDPAGGDPFGISQYGILNNNAIFKQTDYEGFYQANCMTNDHTNSYNQRGITQKNPVTGQPENYYNAGDPFQGINYCATLQMVTGVAGVTMDADLVAEDEQSTGVAPGGGDTRPPAQSCDLEQIINQFEQSHPDSAVIVRSLSDNCESSVNPATIFTSASLYKLFVAQFLHHQSGKGDLNLNAKSNLSAEAIAQWGENVADCSNNQSCLNAIWPSRPTTNTQVSANDCLPKILSHSDNVCGKFWLDYSRSNGIENFLDSEGYNQTSFPGGNLQTSAADVANLMEKISRGTFENAQVSGQVEQLLQKQYFRQKIPAKLPSTVAVANKTGETSSVSHDSALIQTPDTEYLLVVLTKMGRSSAANTAIADLSLEVYNQLKK
jgi:beta-lactamase class A